MPAAIYSLLLEKAAFPWLLKATRSRFWQLFQEMMRLEAAPLEELERLQWERFRRLLEHAYERVPFVRERMLAAGVEPDGVAAADDLTRLPITTKAEIQRNFPDRVVATGVDSDDWQYISTRGTADRLMVIHDFAKRDLVRAAAVRSLYCAGGYRVGRRSLEIPPDICSIACGDEGEPVDGVLAYLWSLARNGDWRNARAVSDLRGLVERSWVFRRRTLQPFGPRGSTLPEAELAAYAEQIRSYRPFLLKALPTYLQEIARHVERRGAPPLPVEVVKPMGSSVSPAMRAVIERSFSGRYHEEYGSAEFGDMSCDCEESEGLHQFTDLFLFEVVRAGRSCAEGELGKILITDLGNFAMPMIRYQIGDVGRLTRAPHGCGRQAPRLKIEGRLEDTLVTAEGIAYSNDQMMDFFYGRGDVDQFQLREGDSGELSLDVVPANGGPPPTPRLSEELREFLASDVEVRVRPVKSIRPEASGKFRFIHSRSFERLS